MKISPPLFLTETERLNLLTWPEGRVEMVLDTDTYNEIDDQFAIVYSLLAQDKLQVEAIYAAPFHNHRSEGPGDGMEKSYEEIQRVLNRLPNIPHPPIFKGSAEWLKDRATPVESPAVDDLIDRARSRKTGKPLYVVGIGALTNIASALLKAPDIASKVVVVWLGGTPSYWHNTLEFNLEGDWNASRFLFDSGAAVIFFPCAQVVAMMHTTLAEMERFVKGRGAIGDYLFEIYRDYTGYDLTQPGVSKHIWDLAPIAWLINPKTFDTVLSPSPILTRELTWSINPGRHLVREARLCWRDRVYKDLFFRLKEMI